MIFKSERGMNPAHMQTVQPPKKEKRRAISKGGGCGVEANVYFTMELLLQKVPIEAIDLGIKKKNKDE